MNTPVRVTPGLVDGVLEEIRVAMARRRWSQRALARSIGEPEHWVSRRLNGKVDLSVGELLRIANALGVEPCSLLRNVTPHQTVAGLVAVSGVERRPVRLTPSMSIAA